MTEQQVGDSREGLDERLPAGSIPGLFHQFSLEGSLCITDVKTHPEDGTYPTTEDSSGVVPREHRWSFGPYPGAAWSFQLQVPDFRILTPAGQEQLFDKLSEHRVHNHPRRMKVTLHNPMASFSTLNEDVRPHPYEFQPISALEFEIPIEHPEASYELQWNSDEDEPVMTGSRCAHMPLTIETDVTCFHTLPDDVTRTNRSLAQAKDVYLTKERMTIISDLPSFKRLFDEVAHGVLEGEYPEKSTADSCDLPFSVMWSEKNQPSFQGDMTLVRLDNSGCEHLHKTTATHSPSRKSVTRPAAEDGYSFVTFVRDYPATLGAIEFMIPEES
ncbi:hypothetical protein L198_07039 [Cryptococcus wingfieldii CBS 7118]|uniref:Uncharacterized protein n=1 Tax=Cryptococcus wingfieldii CBS 7118 TaxID=1295528 RepID=A0A1E3IG63_9TREE|nr:hypothetical protein L198_07039 [Cryptococcus wingfieldii CBS 7118]ODN87415.1 hypothetical protein L198_07039 [Cryptococcus wingfieldii CBS 7118]